MKFHENTKDRQKNAPCFTWTGFTVTETTERQREGTARITHHFSAHQIKYARPSFRPYRQESHSDLSLTVIQTHTLLRVHGRSSLPFPPDLRWFPPGVSVSAIFSTKPFPRPPGLRRQHPLHASHFHSWAGLIQTYVFHHTCHYRQMAKWLN